ncbi:hypothetical protein N2152v2_011278 [Parachlorella kessleri]
MPPRQGTKPVVVTDWGLPRLCNFLTQADGNSAKELAQFITALEDPQLAVRHRALMPPALSLQYLAEQRKEKAALAVAAKLCQDMKPLLAEQGGPFTRVQAAFMAVVAAALTRWLESGLTPLLSLHHALSACLGAHRYIHKVKGAERVHGLAASALCDCAVALVIDWAACQQDLIPEPPTSLVGSEGVLRALEAPLAKGPPDGEPRGLWLLAVPAAARVVEELGLCGDDAVEEAVLLHLAPPLLKTGCWAGLRPPMSLTEPKSWDIVTSIVKGAKYVVGLGLRESQVWEGSDDGQASLEDIGNDEGVIAGVSTLLVQLSRLYTEFCLHGWPEDAPCTLPDVMFQITACVAALRSWVEVDVDMSDFYITGMPAFVEMCYNMYKSGWPLLHRAFERFFAALKLGLALCTRAMVMDVEIEGTEAQDAFREHGGLEAVLRALESLKSVKEVCDDIGPDRLHLMKHLLACLEAAVKDNETSQEWLLEEGGVQLLLRLAVLDVSPKQEAILGNDGDFGSRLGMSSSFVRTAALKARNEDLARGMRMSAGLRSVLSVVATLVRCAGAGCADAPENLAWNQQLIAKAAEVASAADIVRLLLWEPAPPLSGKDFDFDPTAPNLYSLNESCLTLAALLAELGPSDALRPLAASRHLLDGLLRVGRNSLKAAADLLASAGGQLSMSLSMPGSPLVLSILNALAETEFDPGWAVLPLHWEFLRERPTLGLLRDTMLAAAERGMLMDRLVFKVPSPSLLLAAPAVPSPCCFRTDGAAEDLPLFEQKMCIQTTGFLTLAAKLLKALTHQPGPLGEDLCLTVDTSVVGPVSEALPWGHQGRNSLWAKGMGPLMAEVASVAQHVQRVRCRRQQGLQQMEDEAARIAAELIAEEEGEQQRQRQKKEKEQSKKQKRKASKAAAKQQRQQPGGGAAGSGVAGEEGGADAAVAAGSGRGQLQREGDAALAETPGAGWLRKEPPGPSSSTTDTVAPSQQQRSSSAELLALAAPQWGRAAPGANGQAPNGLALAMHLSDPLPGGAQEHGWAAAGVAVPHPLGPAEREPPGDSGSGREQGRPGEPGALGAAGDAANRRSLAGEGAAGAAAAPANEPTAGAAAGSGEPAAAGGAAAARAAAAALKGLRLRKKGLNAVGRPASVDPPSAMQQQERQCTVEEGHPTGRHHHGEGTAAGREAAAAAAAAVAGGSVASAQLASSRAEHVVQPVTESQADPPGACRASPVVPPQPSPALPPPLAPALGSGSPVGQTPTAQPYQGGTTSHQLLSPTHAPPVQPRSQQQGHRLKQDQDPQGLEAQPQSHHLLQQHQSMSIGSSLQAAASPSRARSEGHDASFQELLSYLLPGVTLSPRRSTTQPPSSLPVQPAPGSVDPLPAPGVPPLAGLGSAAPAAVTPPPPPLTPPTQASMSPAGDAGSGYFGQWHNSGSHDGGIGISKTCGIAAADPGVGSSAGAAGALTGEAWGHSDRLRGVLTCPLTQQLLVDPVICEDGLSYERSVVQGRQARTRSNFALKQLLDSLGL